MHKTPRELGFIMPAEWEKHSAVWLAWPYDKIDFPNGTEGVEKIYTEAVVVLSNSETVNLLVTDLNMENRVKNLLKESGANLLEINFHIAQYVSFWMRDVAPLFLVNKETGELGAAKWIFNAWGNKYQEFLKDDKVAEQMNDWLNIEMFEPGIVMEGGSLEVNGKGTLMTTESCLLNKNRNPKLSKDDIEKYLRDYLGVRHFIWLKDGIAGDDTDGHIDDMVRFVGADKVLCAYEEDMNDENYLPLKENYDILTNSFDQDGKIIKVIKLPMPKRLNDDTGRRLPASYANFYIGNKVVLVPVFKDSNDEKAIQIIQACFPEREVVGVDARDLVFALGTFHCMTQQQPAI
jgi:agmatine deiminase